MWRMALPLVLAAASCTPWPPEGTGGLADRVALPPAIAVTSGEGLAEATQARLVCLDARYESLAAAGLADRRPALAARARDARRDALRWTAGGLVQDGALAAESYARLLSDLGGSAAGC